MIDERRLNGKLHDDFIKRRIRRASLVESMVGETWGFHTTAGAIGKKISESEGEVSNFTSGLADPSIIYEDHSYRPEKS